MKAAPILLTVALALVGAGRSGAYVPGPAGLAPRTTVYFLEPETFTDLKDRDGRTEDVLAALKKYLIEQANRYVPSGFKFTVTVTDLVTSQVKVYLNPDLHPADPLQDTSALPCS